MCNFFFSFDKHRQNNPISGGFFRFFFMFGKVEFYPVTLIHTLQWPSSGQELFFRLSSCFLWHQFFIISPGDTKKCSLKFHARVQCRFSCLHFTETRSRLTKMFALLPNFTATLEMCWIHAQWRHHWKWGVDIAERGKKIISQVSFLYFFSFFSLHPSQLDKQKQSVIDKMSSNYSPRIMFSNRSSFIICRRLIKALFFLSFGLDKFYFSFRFSPVRQENMEKS